MNFHSKTPAHRDAEVELYLFKKFKSNFYSKGFEVQFYCSEKEAAFKRYVFVGKLKYFKAGY